jgi:proteasome lid subunit RPN8/RPN11
LLDRLRAEAEAGGKEEICGLLVGNREAISEAIPLGNLHPSPVTGFLLDPESQVAASRAARTAGKGIAGHYHSHPSGNAAPSAADAALAQEEGVLWLIVTAAEARLWISTCNGSVSSAFEPVEIVDCKAAPCNLKAHRPIGTTDTEGSQPGALKA